MTQEQGKLKETREQRKARQRAWNVQVYLPVEGHWYNPLLKFPRNNPCFCGSKKKYKACCLRLQPAAVPLDWYNKIKGSWDKIVSGEINIVPPQEKNDAGKDSAVRDLPLVPEGYKGVLA